MMRSALLILFSLLATYTLAQAPSAPTLTAVTQSENRLFAVVSWTSTYSCPVFCYFQIYRDDDVYVDSKVDLGEGSFSFSIYFGEAASDLTYGTHSFYVKHL